MAVPNMIVTLVANTTKFNSGLRKAGAATNSFGSIAKKGLAAVGVALAGLAIAAARFVPDLIRMGVEARKADIRLEYVAKNMSGLGKATDATVARLKDYADQMQFATGADDEQIKAIQAKLLTFKALEKTVAKAGGTFDRVTKLAFDLVAVGFGDAETNAVRLARMMQDPIKNIGLFKRVGIEFTTAEQDKIQALMESNDLLGAQEIILGRLEEKVGGLAEATASPLEIIGRRFEEIGESIGTALLPFVDEFAKKFGDWINGPDGKKAIADFVQYFKDFGAWVTSADGKKAIDDLIEGFKLTLQVLGGIMSAMKWISSWLGGPDYKKLNTAGQNAWNLGNGSANSGPSGSGPLWSQGMGGGRTIAPRTPGSVNINFNTPVDSVSAGREVKRVLDSYARANGAR